MADDMPIGIRVATTLDDLTYVRHSWSRSAYSAFKSECYFSRQAHVPLHTLYGQLFKAWQDRILKRATCKVAFNPEDETQLFGFIIYEPGDTPILHYVQVKKDFWRHHVAARLLADAGIKPDAPAVYSFGLQLGAKHIPKAWTFVPYYLQTQLEQRK